VGAYVGGWLSSQLPVTLVDGWREHVTAIEGNGLTIDDARGRSVLRPRALHYGELDAALRGTLDESPFDLALICVKAYDTARAVELISPFLRPAGLLVTLQNGMNEDTLAGIVGAARVLGAVVTGISVNLTSPGHVLRSVAGNGSAKPVFLVGGISGGLSEEAAAVAGLLGRVDTAAVTADLRGERWLKLSANCVVNGPCALLGMSTPELMRETAVHPFLAALALETIEVGAGLGFPAGTVFGLPAAKLRAVASGDPAATADFATTMAYLSARLTDSSLPSTAQDLRRGRRTEIDYLNGYVAAKAALAGRAAPANEFVVRGVRMIEDGRLAAGEPGLWRALASWPATQAPVPRGGASLGG
jgi:2-dehydropantoate 2-reductase